MGFALSSVKTTSLQFLNIKLGLSEVLRVHNDEQQRPVIKTVSHLPLHGFMCEFESISQLGFKRGPITLEDIE